MRDRHPLRAPAIGFGAAWLVAIVLLGDLLGSTADASTAYENHFAEDASVNGDIVGGLALVLAAAMLLWVVVVARQTAPARPLRTRRDLCAAFGIAAAASIVTAAGLLLTVPMTTALGRLTDDPGIEAGVQAGIAQAGSVSLFVAALVLGATVVLIAQLGGSLAVLPGWMRWAGWAVAIFLALGWSVVLLLPVGFWAIALGATWREGDRSLD